MAEIRIRAALRDDLPRLTEIYNYYVVNTPVTLLVLIQTMLGSRRDS